MDISQPVSARMGQAAADGVGSVPVVREVIREVAVIQEVERDPAARFNGKRRAKMTKTCACGCGRKFSTTFPNQQYFNEAHKKRAYRAASRNVQG